MHSKQKTTQIQSHFKNPDWLGTFVLFLLQGKIIKAAPSFIVCSRLNRKACCMDQDFLSSFLRFDIECDKSRPELFEVKSSISRLATFNFVKIKDYLLIKQDSTV